MKKIHILYLLLILTSGNIFSQSGWFWQNPTPSGNRLSGVQMINDVIGLSVGFKGTLLKTTNACQSWNIINLNTNRNLRCLDFIDLNTGWIGADTGLIMRTTNGGLTWQNIYVDTLRPVICINFVNSQTGWLSTAPLFTTYSHVYKSTNGGLNWVNQNMCDSCNFRKLYFFSVDTGIAVGQSMHIIKTTNGGLTWQNKNFTFNSAHLYDVCFINNSTGWACGTYGSILKTTNGGENWTEQPTNVGFDLWGISFFNENLGVTIGTDGIHMLTTNGGANWQWSAPIIKNGQYSITKHGQDSIISVGDGGINWKFSATTFLWNQTNDHVTNGDIKSFYFTDEFTGYAACADGMLKTTNKGSNWMYVNNTDGFNSVYFINNETGWGVCPTGLMYGTTNGGSSWTSINTNMIGADLYSVYFKDQNTGFICGPSIKSTTNGGLNWVTQTTVGNDLRTIFFTDSLTGWVGGKSGKLFRTNNGGLNWSIYNFSNSFDCYSLFFTDNFTGYACGSAGTLRKTTDGGNSWNNLVSRTSEVLNGISFYNDLTGYTVGKNGVIRKTTNSGVNWDIVDVTINDLNCVNIQNDSIVYFGGRYGSIIKTTNGGNPIAIYINNIETPVSFSIQQNYPNPFNPVTKIKFDLPNQSNAKIIIYDLLGREITTLVNEQLKPGSYEVDWDASAFASGVYFYSLITDNFVETKRMVLVK